MNNIVLVGADGVGKTTLANYMRDNYGYEVRSFANRIKDIVHEINDGEPQSREEKEEVYRDQYIKVGQRAKEMYGNDVWAKAMDFSGDRVIIDDCRFLSEVNEAIDHNYVIVYVWDNPEVPEQYEIREIVYALGDMIKVWNVCTDHPIEESFKQLEAIAGIMRVDDEKAQKEKLTLSFFISLWIFVTGVGYSVHLLIETFVWLLERI